MQELTDNPCNLCNRECKVNRRQGEKGYCFSESHPVVARAALHMWEEPCISGDMGSGAVFFAGCSLRCIYCQNYELARGRKGREVTTEELSDIFLSLQEQGAANINLVTPDHYTLEVIPAVRLARKKGLALPVIYNCSGYEKEELIRSLRGTVDIFLTDFKYMEKELALKYSFAEDYPEVAGRALAEMVKLVGEPVFDERGMMQKGVIVRHLLLPGHKRNARKVIDYIKLHYGDRVILSLMNQYTPFERLKEREDCRELCRKVTKREYEAVIDYALSLGMENVFIQEGETAEESFIPEFDGEGVPERQGGVNMAGRKRPTIGMMVSGIMDDFTRPACKGAMKIAKELDVNLIVIPGKYIDRDVSDNPDLAYEYQYSSGFSFVRPENLDALIVAAGSIGCFATRERIREMVEQFKGIPCVLISYQLEGYPYVQFDNASGIREGMDYLIEKMGCRHIGMLGGSLDNTDAQERRAAYIEALEKHGLLFDEKAYVTGNFTRNCTGAVRQLLDDNPELDAVFCVNDDTAIGLYEELNHRKKLIGRDIRIIGYDDVIQSAKMSPPLSSVRADSTELGEEALRMAVAMAAGEDVQSHILPARFIRRESAGNQFFEEKNGEIPGLKTVEDYFNDSFYRYRNERGNSCMVQIWEAFRRLTEPLLCIVKDGVFQVKDVPEIFEALTQFLDARGIEFADLSILLSCFEEVYRIQKRELTGMEDKYELQKLYFTIYRKILQATDTEIGKLSENKEKENYAMKMFIRDALSFEKGNDLSYASMISNLEWLGIKNACIYTFKEPVTHLAGEYFKAPEELYLKAVLRNGKVESIPAIVQKTPLSLLFRRSLQGTEGETTFMCAPLFSNEVIYGLVFCNLTEQVFLNGEFLINQMSSAAKMITLLKANEKIQQELEESLLALKENNVALDNLSKSDGLTGIWNRRGFEIEGDKLIREARAQGQHILAVYVDMNNLKIINDRYGHEEGDFSIKLISAILSERMKNRGIAGRIGGDEFACLLITEKEDDGRKLIEDIYRDFHSFNKGSSKVYNITVSAGAVNLPADQVTSLQEMLTQADEKLYEVKKYRKKDVVKREYRR